MRHKCPVCNKTLKLPRPKEQDEAPFFPFCSKRCKLIDLGTWLDGQYKIISPLKSRGATADADSADAAPQEN